MSWGFLIFGIIVSTLLMLLLAMKWKFPERVAWAGASAVALIVALAFIWIYPLSSSVWVRAMVLLGQVIVSLALGLSLVLLRFWRDPERAPPSGRGLVLSPADGKIGYVMSLDSGSTPMLSKQGRDFLVAELTGANRLTAATCLIGVEMSFLDVHVNRCPISGKVTLLKQIEGQFMSLGREEAQFLNARCTTVIEGRSLTLAVVQIASRLVRRVESYLSLNATVTSGQRLGMIRFGSLVAVVLPQREDIQILVKPGDRVTAGESILACYEEQAQRGDE